MNLWLAFGETKMQDAVRVFVRLRMVNTPVEAGQA